MKAKLLELKDCILIEDSKTDMFWGGYLDGSQNWLGKVLMEYRDANMGMNKD